MVYLWRYLRRPIADGSADVLDVAATIDQVARQGFFLAPAYRQREVNRARLLLLIDQDGSVELYEQEQLLQLPLVQPQYIVQLVNQSESQHLVERCHR